MKLYAPSIINEIKEKYGFKFAKSLGQNFLTNKNIIDEIINICDIGPDDLVIEIGPGIGVITCEAAKKAREVIAIEIDKNLIPILQDTLAEFSNVRVVNQDVLKTDINGIIEEAKSRQLSIQNPPVKSVKIIGNLPYYITTPIIMKVLEDGIEAESITIMMQKEVADRIKAKPSTKDYGALSVAVQYYCETAGSINVPKEVFYPRPKIDSTVLKLKLLEKAPTELLDKNTFFNCVKASFGQRRKTLNNSLSGMGGVSKDLIKEALDNAGVDGIRRGETLTLEEFGMLANEIFKLMGEARRGNNISTAQNPPV